MREAWLAFIDFAVKNLDTILLVIVALCFGFCGGVGLIELLDRRAEKKRRIWYIGQGGMYTKNHYNDDSKRLR